MLAAKRTNNQHITCFLNLMKHGFFFDLKCMFELLLGHFEIEFLLDQFSCVFNVSYTLLVQLTTFIDLR